MAFLGGATPLPARIYLPIVGGVMIASSIRLVRPTARAPEGNASRPSPIGARIALGAGVGLVSGLTGTGGGIFLLPALQVLGWAGPKAAVAVVSPFVLATSTAGLVGLMSVDPGLPTGLSLWAPAAVIGGLIGARAGHDHLDPRIMRGILATLLAAAGLKLLVS
jgi:uncharacterized membrane protein YfcA